MIRIEGDGGTTSTGNDSNGVLIEDTNTRVTSIEGAILVTGLGGGGGTSNNHRGVYVRDGAVIDSTGTGAGAATITLDGTGGSTGLGNSGFGVQIAGATSTVTSIDGAILITGQGGGSGNTNNQTIHLFACFISY